MEKNVGGFDRTWRLVLGPVLVLVGIAAFSGFVSLSATVAAIALIVGGVFTATGVLRMCFINRLLGIDTSGGASEASDAPAEKSAERPQ